MLKMLVGRKVALAVVSLIGVFAFSGCDLWGGGLPANAHLGNNNVSNITLSSYAGEVDVTLDNPISRLWVQEYVNCGGDTVAGQNCLAAWVNDVTAGTAGNGGAVAAANDIGFQQGVGALDPYGDEWNAAVTYAWGGGGQANNCIGFHSTFNETFVNPSNPSVGTASVAGSWYTIWPFSLSGWNADGAANCPGD